MLTTDDAPAAVLRLAAGRAPTGGAAALLDPTDPADRATLLGLVADRAVLVVDTVPAQLDELVRSRVPNRALAADEVRDHVAGVLGGVEPELFGRWVHQPWAGRVVHVLPSDLHRELRLDRNRLKITKAEQTGGATRPE